MLFNRKEFQALDTPAARALYLLTCDKGVAMIATMEDLVPVSCDATVVVLTDCGDEISLAYTAPEGDYTDEELIELANDKLRETLNSQ